LTGAGFAPALLDLIRGLTWHEFPVLAFGRRPSKLEGNFVSPISPKCFLYTPVNAHILRAGQMAHKFSICFAEGENESTIGYFVVI